MAVQRLIMPKLGAYTEDPLLTEWLVDEGEEIAAGAAVFELETDKTTAEVEAETAGWVHHVAAAGDTVPIGATVALIAETKTEYDDLLRKGGGDNVASPAEAQPGGAEPPQAADASAAPGRPEVKRDAPLVSPRARALLKKLGFSTDAAREIDGSGPGGRITDGDVAAWAEGRTASQADAPATGSSEDLTVRATIPLRGRRRTIASRMVSSLQHAAQLTSVTELDATELVELRRQLNQAGPAGRIGITAIFVKLVATALHEHPLLNSRVTETDVELLAEINIAVAVDMPEGLIAPVVTGADKLSIEEINASIADLATRARDGSLTPADVAGGTFTVSNGGVHPVDITTAILNPPQCGILWIGRIRDRPVVVEGAVAVRPTLQACLTFDHRAVDGGPAAQFLATIEDYAKDPSRFTNWTQEP